MLPELLDVLFLGVPLGTLRDTAHGRLLSTLLTLLVVGLGGHTVLPRLVDRGLTALKTRIPVPDLLDDYVDVTSAYLTDELDPVHWITITIQSVAVLTGSVALLFIWGESQAAIKFLRLVYRSLPELGRVTATILLLLAAYSGSILIDNVLDRIKSKSTRWDDHQAGIVFRTIQVLMFVVIGAVTLSIWNVNLGGLLVGTGFLGIIIGMATRQTIASLVAGVVLMFSRPFEIGDWVEIGDEEGLVVNITMVNTRLENLDGEVVVIPNDIVGNQTLKNKTRKGRLRITMNVSVDYDSDPKEAVKVAEEAMERVDEVLKVPTPRAVPQEFGESGVVIELRYWIDNPNAQRRANAKAGVIREVKTSFDQAGIDIPYPHRHLKVEESQQSRVSSALTDFQD